jgi:hypothetical protein
MSSGRVASNGSKRRAPRYANSSIVSNTIAMNSLSIATRSIAKLPEVATIIAAPRREPCENLCCRAVGAVRRHPSWHCNPALLPQRANRMSAAQSSAQPCGMTSRAFTRRKPSSSCSAATKRRMINQRLRSTSYSCSHRNTVNVMRRRIVALATTCADVSRLVAARTRRRVELVVRAPTMGILSLPVKMQPVVRALTADTLSFEPNRMSTIDTVVPVGRQGRRANARPTEEGIGDANCRTQIRST